MLQGVHQIDWCPHIFFLFSLKLYIHPSLHFQACEELIGELGRRGDNNDSSTAVSPQRLRPKTEKTNVTSKSLRLLAGGKNDLKLHRGPQTACMYVLILLLCHHYFCLWLQLFTARILAQA